MDRTRIKNHKIIFRTLLDTQTSPSRLITSTLALAKQVNSDSAEQVHDPHEQTSILHGTTAR